MENREPNEFLFTFRVQALPAECDHAAAKELIEAAACLTAGSSDVEVHSLAPSACHRREKTATVTSKNLALALRPRPPEADSWTLTIPASRLPAAFAAVASSDDGLGKNDITIPIDIHFRGFTPLHTFDHGARHNLE
jgi:hypothetical protein